MSHGIYIFPSADRTDIISPIDFITKLEEHIIQIDIVAIEFYFFGIRNSISVCICIIGIGEMNFHFCIIRKTITIAVSIQMRSAITHFIHIRQLIAITVFSGCDILQ